MGKNAVGHTPLGPKSTKHRMGVRARFVISVFLLLGSGNRLMLCCCCSHLQNMARAATQTSVFLIGPLSTFTKPHLLQICRDWRTN